MTKLDTKVSSTLQVLAVNGEVIIESKRSDEPERRRIHLLKEQIPKFVIELLTAADHC